MSTLTLESIALLLVLGSFAGLMAGLLGVGGGLIIVPALILFFESLGFSQSYLTQMALATSLATIIFTSLSSIRTHQLAGLIDWQLVKNISVGLCLGAVVGALFATTISGRFLQLGFGIFAVLIALQMFLQLKPKQAAMPNKFGQYLGGIIVAFISAIFGIGGGSLSVPMLSWFGLEMKKSVAVSAACGLPIAIFSVGGFVVAGWGRSNFPAGTYGFVYLPALLVISITSIIFAHFGAKLAHRLPAQQLKHIFGLFLLVVGLRFIVLSA